MKKVITMLTLGGYNPMYHLSEKSIRRYAKKIGADFIKQDKPIYSIEWEIIPKRLKAKQQRLAWIQKFYIFDLLNKYDRVLYLDSDILVSPHAPDIFEIYQDEKTVYMSSESKYGSKTSDVAAITSILGDIPTWEKENKFNSPKYYNSGVILFSKACQMEHYFNLDDLKKVFNAVELIDQTYINYLIAKHHISTVDIDEEFNWTALFCNHQNRQNAYFIHHNHKGFGKNRLNTFRKDYYQFYQDDSLLEKMIEIIRAKLFTAQRLKKYLFYRIKRLNPCYWRWLHKTKGTNL